MNAKESNRIFLVGVQHSMRDLSCNVINYLFEAAIWVRYVCIW